MVSLELEARLDNLLSTAQKETANVSLFAPIPEREECPICMIPLPLEEDGITFMQCCGKTICCGCTNKNMNNERKKGDKPKCAFCRRPLTKAEKEYMKEIKRLMKNDNPDAFMHMAARYRSGEDGVLQSNTKALEMYIRSAELGKAQAFACIGGFYSQGIAVTRDTPKAMEFYDVAAKKGAFQAHVMLAHYMLWAGKREGEMDWDIVHLKVLASAGHQKSMNDLMERYKNKLLNKEDLTKTLRAFQTSSNAMKSKERDEARAFLQEFGTLSV